MSCCIGWWHPEAMTLFEDLPCNGCEVADVRDVPAPDLIPAGLDLSYAGLVAGL
jgi:hypothetical protein